MHFYIYAWVAHLKTISHWKQESRAAKSELGQQRRAESQCFSGGRHLMMWAAVLRVLLVLFPVVAQAQSALDGFDPGANGFVWSIAVQADGKILVGGGFTTLGGGGLGTTTRNYIGRLNADGSLDTSFNPGANYTVAAIALQADGKILVGGWFTTLGGGGLGTTTRNCIGRLNPDGSLDTSFNPGANGAVDALAVQADGKILVGGSFSGLGGGTGTTTRNRIGRLNANGSLDTSFNPGANNSVWAIAAQADGKILIGGAFTTLGGGGLGTTTRNRIGRLNADGSLDTSFNPGANNSVWAIAAQADGKILVGGWFTTLGGGGTGTTARNRIGRLNADGTLDTSFNPGANSYVYALAVQANGKILAGGWFTTLGGGGTGTTTRNSIGRLNPNGSLDTSFNPGANSYVYALAAQADGKILVGGNFSGLCGGTGTTPRNYVGRLNPDGSLDTSLDPGANSDVNALAVQADGKILVGGNFTTLGGGGTGTTPRSYIGRLNPDGSLETSFNPGANSDVYALAVQADGKILVGGNFTILGGGGTGTTPRSYIGRLNPDGSLETSFNPGANSYVNALAVQADGKILVGGNFSTLGGGGTGTTTRNNIGRLNADGTLDTSFNPGANSYINALAVQADGKILVGGNFTTLGSGGTGTTWRYNIGRLNADGSLDTSFNPGANSYVNALAVQADGKTLVGGNFTTLGGGNTGTTPRSCIGRLNADGTLDTSFNPGANSYVNALAVQADGKILLGGNFTTLGGGGTVTTTRNNIGRLNADGSLDTSLDPGANHVVWAIAVQEDGKILVGGNFTTLGGGGTGTTTRNYIGRLTNTDAALESLAVSVNGSTIIWNRSGTAPEVNRVTYELSPDGSNYTFLGIATRISGGWQLTGLRLLPGQNIFIRTRGFYSSGLDNGSGSIVESVRTAVTASGVTPPPRATLISPTGTIGTSSPIYMWNAVSTAGYYQIRVNDSQTSGKISAWYTSADAGCASGTGTCSVTPSTALANGAAQWWIQTWNDAGYGPWSDPMSFTVAALPGKATLISPSGSISTATPTYSWNAVSESIWYCLWANDAAGSPRIQQWYTAAQAGCASGTGTCSVTPSVALALGAVLWWIQTYNGNGYGPWSSGMTFTVNPGAPPQAATLVSPTGTITTASPTYTWNAVSNATFYYLWVNNGAGIPVIKRWYTAAEANCASGTGTCTITPVVPLAGIYIWWIQTWNGAGYGSWSNGMPFSVGGTARSHAIDRPLGLSGSGDGQSQYPQGLAMGSFGNVLAEDIDGIRIQMIKSNRLLLESGHLGIRDGPAQAPGGLALGERQENQLDIEQQEQIDWSFRG